MTIGRGDIYHVDLNPTRGREQQGSRYVMVISKHDLNQSGTVLVCPITQGGNFARDRGFAISLSGAGMNAQGVVLCNQLRVIDVQARSGKFIEKAPEFIVADVLAKLQTLLD